MKKLIAIFGIVAATSASAFDFGPFNNNYGYVEDNGIFAFNPYSIMDPRWYSTEFTNMINEVDDPKYVVSYQHAPAYPAVHNYDFPVK